MDTPLDRVDLPNSYIGRSVPRPNAPRLLAGQGRYVDDLRLPRMLHAAFLRSPYAHARILRIETAAARSRQDRLDHQAGNLPGVGADMAVGASIGTFGAHRPAIAWNVEDIKNRAQLRIERKDFDPAAGNPAKIEFLI